MVISTLVQGFKLLLVCINRCEEPPTTHPSNQARVDPGPTSILLAQIFFVRFFPLKSIFLLSN